MPGQGLRVEAVGVSGAPAPGRLTTTFRLAGGVLLDSGAATHGIPLDERQAIGHLLLSHAHLDHTLGLPFLLGDARPVVYGLKQTLDVVRDHLLDGHIWPDLSDLATWREVRIGERFEAGPWEVEVGPANHTVPCVSYFFRGGGRAIAIIGDTRFDESLARWVTERAPDLCVVEVSFSDRVAAMARRFGHQTPRDAGLWRRILGPGCQLCLSHLKPGQDDAIRAECATHGDNHLRILADGDVL